MAQDQTSVRWQKIRIDQTSYVINLLIFLSTGLLGYFGSNLNTIAALPSTEKILNAINILIIGLSLISGVTISIARLKYFGKVKLYWESIEEDSPKNRAKEAKIIECIQKKEKQNNILLIAQVSLFVSGITLFLITAGIKIFK